MDGDAVPTATGNIRFGPFVLRPGERVLERDGQRVPLGGRAFDILMVLVERAGEVVSQKVLYERVWPGLNVSEVSLRVQIRALRMALRAGDGAVTYVSNTPARGYSFVAPVSGAVRAQRAETPPAPRTDLPRPLDAFVGRECELADLDERLRTQRLITLVGPGGIGKSRLSVELGWRLRERFPDGVWFVDLAPVANAEFVASAIAAAIGGNLQSAVGVAEALAAFIGGQRALLVLDNCERLIRPIAELTNVLLQKTPTLSILATSLQPIGVAGEHIYRLNPLDLPPPGEVDIAHHSAIALFVERARETDRTFALSVENALTVSELCRGLDGVPLALEMAVARLPLLGLQGLRKGLNERLRMLAPGRRVSLSHHDSLRSMVEWSYELLDPPSAQLFRRLAIFAGSFSLDAAVAVGGSDEIDHWDTLDALGQLIDRSLVIAEPVEPPRYRLLETLRLFASEQLQASGEHDPCSRKHADFYCDFLEDIVEYEQTNSGDMFLARFGAELDNVRAALDWALADGSRSDIAIILGGGLFKILRWLNLYPEAVFYYGRLSPLIPGRQTSVHLARLLEGAGRIIGRGEMKEGAYLLRLSINAYGELGLPLLAASTQVTLAYFCNEMGNTDEAASLNDAAQAILGGSNFMLSQIGTLVNEGSIAASRKDFQRAKAAYLKVRDLLIEMKQPNAPSVLMTIAVIEYAEGNFAAAAEAGQRAVEAISSTRYKISLVLAQQNQSIFLCMAGRVAEARTMAEQAVPLSKAFGSWSVLNCVLAWVLLLATEGHHRKAAQLLGFVREGNARAGIAPGPYQDRTYERIRAIFSENLSPDELSANAKIGAAWTADQALAFALRTGRARGSGREASSFGAPAPSEIGGRRSVDLNRSALH